jgi:hypothetical protein
MICAIDDDECLGHCSRYDMGRPLALCQFHIRVLGELGQRAFEEWYSIELEADDAKAIEAQRAETVKHGSVADESAAPKGFARKDIP